MKKLSKMVLSIVLVVSMVISMAIPVLAEASDSTEKIIEKTYELEIEGVPATVTVKYTDSMIIFFSVSRAGKTSSFTLNENEIEIRCEDESYTVLIDSFNLDESSYYQESELQPLSAVLCESATGFTGASYGYTLYGNGTIKLSESGFETQIKKENSYSNNFMANVSKMQYYVQSLTSKQVDAWLAIRASTAILNALSFLPWNEVSIAAYIGSALIDLGINLGSQENATCALFANWYLEEKEAKDNYLKF